MKKTQPSAQTLLVSEFHLRMHVQYWQQLWLLVSGPEYSWHAALQTSAADYQVSALHSSSWHLLVPHSVGLQPLRTLLSKLGVSLRIRPEKKGLKKEQGVGDQGISSVFTLARKIHLLDIRLSSLNVPSR